MRNAIKTYKSNLKGSFDKKKIVVMEIYELHTSLIKNAIFKLGDKYNGGYFFSLLDIEKRERLERNYFLI